LAERGADFYRPHYRIDGTGRDDYIQSNNGGLTSFYNGPSLQIKGTNYMNIGND